MSPNEPEQEQKQNPLEDLVVDEDKVESQSDASLRDLIKPYISIGKNQKKVLFTGDLTGLNSKARVLLLFLGKFAMKRLGYSSDSSISQKEAIDSLGQEGLPEGTIKATLKLLRDENFISTVSEGRYSIGYDKLAKIKKEFTKNARREN